jgi:DNA repair protein RAD16|eukprot:COSAG02_NODE_1678_length_11359_cov_7.398224_6_plen_78_part_00
MKLLKSELLDACLLRRTKRERSADISLPPRLIQHRHINFNAEEQDYYTGMHSSTSFVFGFQYMASRRLLTLALQLST